MLLNPSVITVSSPMITLMLEADPEANEQAKKTITPCSNAVE
jgi:hypothetical protein